MLYLDWKYVYAHQTYSFLVLILPAICLDNKKRPTKNLSIIFLMCTAVTYIVFYTATDLFFVTFILELIAGCH